MNTQPNQPGSTKETKHRFRPFGAMYGMVVGGIVTATWSAPTGNPAVIATAASVGAFLGAIGGHLLASRLKPNRTMING